MRKKRVHGVAIKSFALLIVLGTVDRARSHETTTPSPNMAAATWGADLPDSQSVFSGRRRG